MRSFKTDNSRVIVLLLASLFLLVFLSTSKAQTAKTVYPEYPEWMYQKRVDALNQNSPILFEYNEYVRAYIDVYMVKRRDHFQEILNKSKLYFPLFEEYLDKYNLPLELKYLAIVESALNPKAKSSSGAMGLWQFLLNSGKMFDLDVTTFTDDRCDPRKSTDAACKYLQYLYNNTGDWQLALAGYNGGVGEVQKAQLKSGKKNYWQLRPHLTEQMRGYVPAFMAVAYCMNYYDKHDFQINPAALSFFETDSVQLKKPSSLSKIASLLTIETSTLANLNPIYTKDYIPVGNQPITIVIPKDKVALFISKEELLYANIDKNTIYKTFLSAKDVNSVKTKKIHTVEDGEYFHKIAMTYNCRIEDIMGWNKMKTKRLFAGQKLIIWQTKAKESGFFFAVEEVPLACASSLK